MDSSGCLVFILLKWLSPQIKYDLKYSSGERIEQCSSNFFSKVGPKVPIYIYNFIIFSKKWEKGFLSSFQLGGWAQDGRFSWEIREDYVWQYWRTVPFFLLSPLRKLSWRLLASEVKKTKEISTNKKQTWFSRAEVFSAGVVQRHFFRQYLCGRMLGCHIEDVQKHCWKGNGWA